MTNNWTLVSFENVGGPLPIVIVWQNQSGQAVVEKLPSVVHGLPCGDSSCLKNRVREIVTDLLGFFPSEFECKGLIGRSTNREPEIFTETACCN
jgi:hypothetical protein